MNQVIIINGPSCAGKTTTAEEICRQTNYKFVHVKIDEAKKYLFTILDSKATPRKIGRPICDEILLQTAKIFLKTGKNIVIDTTFDFDERDEVIATIKNYIAFFYTSEVFFVGIKAPVEERLRRFKENNNNPVRNEATIIAQSNVFELSKEFYDIWFDSSLQNSEEIASKILQRIQHDIKKDVVSKFTIRASRVSDIDDMVSLSKVKRLAYEKVQSQFWRHNGEEGDNAQRKWFKELLADEKYLMFTAISHCKRSTTMQKHNLSPESYALLSDDEKVVGFIIGKLMAAPEVYNPGGLTLMIDDFCVADQVEWHSIGSKLVQEIKAIAKTSESCRFNRAFNIQTTC